MRKALTLEETQVRIDLLMPAIVHGSYLMQMKALEVAQAMQNQGLFVLVATYAKGENSIGFWSTGKQEDNGDRTDRIEMSIDSALNLTLLLSPVDERSSAKTAPFDELYSLLDEAKRFLSGRQS